MHGMLRCKMVWSRVSFVGSVASIAASSAASQHRRMGFRLKPVLQTSVLKFALVQLALMWASLARGAGTDRFSCRLGSLNTEHYFHDVGRPKLERALGANAPGDRQLEKQDRQHT